MYDFGVPSTPVEAEEEEDWFGEGNAFESGEDLASALLALAASPAISADTSEPDPGAVASPAVSDGFLVTESSVVPRVEQTVDLAVPFDPAARRGWSVRAPGAVPLPPRAPGRSGWTIRNSVKVLQHTEEVLNSLRRDAVVATLAAASRAMHPD